MNILYAVQATGNGHISRAIEILPFLQRYGNVDVFLSGSNSSLQTNRLPVRFRSKGISLFYGTGGGLNYWKTATSSNLLRAWKEARNLPVENYSVIINDFESITALACRLKGISSVNFGHQASFQSNCTPRPERTNVMGEWILKNYAKASRYIGLHFQQYDQFICSPIIKESVLYAQPADQGHYCVYLPHYSDLVLMRKFQRFKNIRFQIFSPRVKQQETHQNIQFLPVDHASFTQSMILSSGVITGAGFETPAEALYLGKKLLAFPIRGQYEQLCNAAALEQMGVTTHPDIQSMPVHEILRWMQAAPSEPLHLNQTTASIIGKVMETAQFQENSCGKESLQQIATSLMLNPPALHLAE